MTQDYNIGFPQGTNPYGDFQSPLKKSRSPKASRFGIIGFIVICIIIILVGYVFIYPALTPNKIRGDFLDFAIAPQKDGSSTLWILTDGSFNFTESGSRGSYSRKCWFCKTWMYVVNPVNQSLLKKIKTEYDDVITSTGLVYSNNKVYQIASGFENNEPKIQIRNAETGDMIMDTKDFMGKYNELNSGLTGLDYDKKENIIRLDTKDGRSGVIYSISNEKVYPSNTEYYRDLKKDSTISTTFILKEDGPRKYLYLVKGPAGILKYERTSIESNVYNEEYLEFFVKGSTGQKLLDKVFLDGTMYYYDKDCAIIIHVDQLGKKADRMMTCIDNTGKEKWTISQSELFSKMKIEEGRDSFSTKDEIGVIRSGNLVILKFKREGIMGFNYNTGNKLFTIDI
jgi:hypothetical protein